MVLVAAAAAGPDGLTAFDIPLAYVNHDKFNQPVFGCNHLSGITAGAASALLVPSHYPHHLVYGKCKQTHIISEHSAHVVL